MTWPGIIVEAPRFNSLQFGRVRRCSMTGSGKSWLAISDSLLISWNLWGEHRLKTRHRPNCVHSAQKVKFTDFTKVPNFLHGIVHKVWITSNAIFSIHYPAIFHERMVLTNTRTPPVFKAHYQHNAATLHTWSIFYAEYSNQGCQTRMQKKAKRRLKKARLGEKKSKYWIKGNLRLFKHDNC